MSARWCGWSEAGAHIIEITWEKLLNLRDPLTSAPCPPLDVQAWRVRRYAQPASILTTGCHCRYPSLRFSPRDMLEQPGSRSDCLEIRIENLRHSSDADQSKFNRERGAIGQMKPVNLNQRTATSQRLLLGVISRGTRHMLKWLVRVAFPTLAHLRHDVGYVEHSAVHAWTRNEGTGPLSPFDKPHHRQRRQGLVNCHARTTIFLHQFGFDRQTIPWRKHPTPNAILEVGPNAFMQWDRHVIGLSRKAVRCSTVSRIRCALLLIAPQAVNGHAHC